MAQTEPRIRLRRNQYLRFCEAAGWSQQAKQAEIFGRSDTYISRIVNDESRNISAEFIAAVLLAMPDRKFEDLFEVVPYAAAARPNMQSPPLPDDVVENLYRIRQEGSRERLDGFLLLLRDRGWALYRCAEVLGVSRETVRLRVEQAKPVSGLPRVPKAPRQPARRSTSDVNGRTRGRAVAA